MPISIVANVNVVESESLKVLSMKSLKRSYDFLTTHNADRVFGNPTSSNVRLSSKTAAEYDAVVVNAPPALFAGRGKEAEDDAVTVIDPPALLAARGEEHSQFLTAPKTTTAPQVFEGDSLAAGSKGKTFSGILHEQQSFRAPVPPAVSLEAESATTPLENCYQPRGAPMEKRLAARTKPAWNPTWKIYRVISGHLGWVRAVAFDPGNQWFCTGSADRTIKIWDTATGRLKHTLTGHIQQVLGLAVSPSHKYLFSAGDDKEVKCWDLEYNKVIRSYHGHLSGVYCLSLHPELDCLMTGGRDSVCRVWDMRTSKQIFALAGHESTVCSILTQDMDPQVVTGSHDSTIKLWDMVAGKSVSTLTFHKKSVRALAMHPFERNFASASVDNIKKFQLPRGEFLNNLPTQRKVIVNCMAINADNVLCAGGDDGTLGFWDWKSGHKFQQARTVVQPGSLDCESGIFALSYDMTGTRLVTCEADKTIKMLRATSKENL